MDKAGEPQRSNLLAPRCSWGSFPGVPAETLEWQGGHWACSLNTWLCHAPAVRFGPSLFAHLSSDIRLLPLGDLTHSCYSNYCSYARASQIQAAEPDPFPGFLRPEFKRPQTSLRGVRRPLEEFGTPKPASPPSRSSVNGTVTHPGTPKESW